MVMIVMRVKWFDDDKDKAMRRLSLSGIDSCMQADGYDDAFEG